jgi:putative transposase
MQVFGLNRCFRGLSKYNSIELEELSEKARLKFQVLDLLMRSGNVRLTSEHYRISRATVYRWKKKYNPKDPHSLEERSKCPHRFRGPQWTRELADAVKRFRESFGWGKDKLVVLVRREGYRTSASTVGRILAQLKSTGELEEPPKRRFRAGRARAVRRYALSKPKGYAVKRPGDLVQVDTLDLNRHLSQRRYQFSARDTISRWDVLEVHERASSGCAAIFLTALKSECPFPVKAIQVDWGSEFCSHLEEAC